jgi:hypothetical protein
MPGLRFLTRAMPMACALPRASGSAAAKIHGVREKWRLKSFEFTAVDMIAHHFKHTQSSHDRPNPHHDGIPLSFALGLGKKSDQLETRNA